MTKYLALLLKVILSAGLIAYAFTKIDFGSAWETLLSVPPETVAFAMLLLLIQLAISAYRLQELLVQLGQTRYPMARLLDACWVGAFFSQTFVSFVGGDAMRIWRLIRFRVPAPVATQGILLDRLSGFAGIVLVLLATIPFLVPAIESLEMRVGLLLIVAGSLCFILLVFVLRRLPAWLARTRPVAMVQRFAAHGLRIARSGRGVVIVLGISTAVQLINVAILFFLARGLSVEITAIQCLLFMPTVLFLSMLPISFAGWGVREGAMVAALAVLGIPAYKSLALSICFGLCLIFISLPGGLLWFIARNRPAKEDEMSRFPT